MKARSFIPAASAALLVLVPSSSAMTSSQLARRAHGNPFRCNLHHDQYTQVENKCVVRVVFRRHPQTLIQAMRIVGCESNWDEYDVNSSSQASGLAQFLPSTWRNLPRRISRHRVFHPVWNIRGMFYLWHADGGFREWVCQ